MTTIALLQNSYKTTATRAQNSHYVLRMGDRRRKDPSRGERLGNLRLDVDKSAIHVAREIGVSKGRIYAWENGDPINSENLDKLADALDTSREFILDGTPPDRKPVGAEATVSEILEKVTAAEARQVQMQSDLARLILRVEALQEDLRSTRAPGGQARGGQG